MHCMITIYFKTTPIIIKFLEQCILPRIMPVSKSDAGVNINFVRHPTIDISLDKVGESCKQKIKSRVPQNYGVGWFK